jgi:hypothetical protein
MDGKLKDALRARWMGRMEAAFERMFAENRQEELVTLAEREDMAVAIGNELAALLLEQHVATDPATTPTEASATVCPSSQGQRALCAVMAKCADLRWACDLVYHRPAAWIWSSSTEDE